jgi:integral membrane sensor domain MASE1
VRPYRWIEGAGLLVSTCLITAYAAETTVRPLFLVFPFLIWAAVRFQERGATVCVLIVSVVTTYAAAIGAAGFNEGDLFANMAVLQAFNGSAALTALLLAALIHQRDQAHRDLQRACTQLATVRRDRLLDALRLRGSP